MTLNAYIARQPIVDGKHNLVAYELLFRDAPNTQAARIENDAAAGIDVISNALCNMGTQWLLKGKLAFINMDTHTLLSDFSSLLPADKVVLEILETVQATPEVLDKIRAFKQAGFRIALDDYVYTPERADLLPLADYVKVDVLGNAPADTINTIKQARRHPAKLLAEKVEKREQFEQYKKLGFELFQGYYFARPENLSAKVVNPTQATVIQLMEKVRQEADLKQIEEGFKRDVALTFKLLRYINSAGFGLTCEVQSIRHAVSILGYKPLSKWLTLLLVTASPSLLDALLETPMDQLMERVHLPENVADALLHRSGIYGPLLSLAEACELGDAARIERLAEDLFLSPDQVNEAHLNALAWVEQLGLD
ncbi:MAG: EAL domain-containing protein [Thiobacillaceae bacterium]|nr:EAL domain-containing protein [Thiobacillaceae bacterium]